MNESNFFKGVFTGYSKLYKSMQFFQQDIGQIVEEKFNTAAPITLLNCKKVQGYLLHRLAKPIFLFMNCTRVALHDWQK